MQIPTTHAGDITPTQAQAWLQIPSPVTLLVDVRTDAERIWVGFVPDSVWVPWKIYPSMVVNPDFDVQLNAVVPNKSTRLLFLCRSGVRSIPAAERATVLGFMAYNVLQGFEGDANANQQRGHLGGWRHAGLPWQQ